MNSHGTRQSHLRFWLWLGVIGLCLGGGGIRLWQNHQRKATSAAWERQQTRLLNAGLAARQLIRKLDDRIQEPDGTWHDRTRTEVERVLNDGKPFTPVPAETGDNDNARVEWANWTDPVSGWGFILKFRDGGLTGYRLTNTGTTANPQPPGPPPFDRFTHKVQRAFAGSFSFGIGTVAWLIAFVLYLGWKQQRKVLAEVMLALTLLCGTAWLTWPGYSLTVKGIFSNDMLFWAVLMLVVSLAVLAAAKRMDARPPWPTCAHCGYNLTGNVSGVCPECGEAIQMTPSEE